MTVYKAGDFTNGKMNDIFKDAVSNGEVSIFHKQFGEFILLEAPDSSDVVHKLNNIFYALDNYHLREMNFYAHCFLFSGEYNHPIDVINYAADIKKNQPFEILLRLYKEFGAIGTGYLNEIYFSFIEDISDIFSRFSQGDLFHLQDIAESSILKDRINDYVFSQMDIDIDDLATLIVECYSFLAKKIPFIELKENGYSLTFKFKYQYQDNGDFDDFICSYIQHDDFLIDCLVSRHCYNNINEMASYALKPEDLELKRAYREDDKD